MNGDAAGAVRRVTAWGRAVDSETRAQPPTHPEDGVPKPAPVGCGPPGPGPGRGSGPRRPHLRPVPPHTGPRRLSLVKENGSHWPASRWPPPAKDTPEVVRVDRDAVGAGSPGSAALHDRWRSGDVRVPVGGQPLPPAPGTPQPTLRPLLPGPLLLGSRPLLSFVTPSAEDEEAGDAVGPGGTGDPTGGCPTLQVPLNCSL